MIVMYSMEGCELCCTARKILDDNNIKYMEKRFAAGKIRKGGFPYFKMNDRFYNYEEFITLIADYLFYRIKKEAEA